MGGIWGGDGDGDRGRDRDRDGGGDARREARGRAVGISNPHGGLESRTPRLEGL